MPSLREMLGSGKPRAPAPLGAGLFGALIGAGLVVHGSWYTARGAGLVGAVTSERPSEGGTERRSSHPCRRLVTHRECVDLQATDVRTLHADVP